MVRVLVIATSRKTRGGITAVVKAHETGKQWKAFHCHWVQTHRDGLAWRKVLYFVAGFLDFILRLPFYDIVHIHTADYGTQRRKRIFQRIAQAAGKKVIMHLHSSGSEYSINSDYKSLYKQSFSRADRVVVLSESWKREVVSELGIDESKVKVLYNPCPPINAYHDKERDKSILFAGTLTHRKGYDDLIKAFAIVARHIPDWKLKIAGNGEIDKGKELAKEMNISDRVDFLGWINGTEKDYQFRTCSIFCLPSYSEGFPMGVLDAWAYGLPVVSTPVGGIVDVCKDNENMLIFPPGDVQALADKLKLLIEDSKLRYSIATESRALSEGLFSMKSIANNLQNIYTSLL